MGNKCDMESRRVVSRERGDQLATQQNIPFLETSAKTNMNIDETFEKLARLILKKVSPRAGEPGYASLSLSNRLPTKVPIPTPYRIRGTKASKLATNGKEGAANWIIIYVIRVSVLLKQLYYYCMTTFFNIIIIYLLF